jgi:hypothetical protein
MASINIYVSEDLKERMAKVDANWSEICRGAIEAELHRLEQNPAVPPPSDKTVAAFPITQHIIDQGTIIRLTPQGRNQKQQVLEISQWLENVRQSVAGSYAVCERAGKLLTGDYESELLIPGYPWYSGEMKLDLKFTFKPKQQDQETIPVKDA